MNEIIGYSNNQYSFTGIESGLKPLIYQQIMVSIKSRILKLGEYNRLAAEELRGKYEALIQEYSGQNMRLKQNSIIEELADLDIELKKYEASSMLDYLKYKINTFIDEVKENPEDYTIDELKKSLDELTGEIDSLNSEKIDYKDIKEIFDLKTNLQAIILAIYTRRNNVDTLIDSGLINKDDEVLLENFCRELNNQLNSQQENNSQINSLMMFTPKWIYSRKIWNWIGDIYNIPIEVEVRETESLSNKANSEEYGLSLPEEKQNVFINIINYFKKLFSGKLVTQEPGTISFLKELDVNTLSNNISKQERIKLEKTRMMKVGRAQDFSDEELYIPDGKEYIMSFLKDIEKSDSKLDITYTDKNGLLKRFTGESGYSYYYTGGSKSIRIYDGMSYLQISVFMFINKIDTLFGTNYFADCIKEILEDVTKHGKFRGHCKIYNAAKQSYKKLVEYDNSLESIDDALVFSERRSKHYAEMGEIVANNTPKIGTAKFLSELNSVNRIASMVPKMKRIEFEKRRLKEEEIKQEELLGGIYIPDGMELLIAIKNCINNTENDIRFLAEDGETYVKLVYGSTENEYVLQFEESVTPFQCKWLSIDTIKYCIEIDKMFGSNYTSKIVKEYIDFEIDEGVELPTFLNALEPGYKSLKKYYESEQFVKDKEFYQNKRKEYYDMHRIEEIRSEDKEEHGSIKEKHKFEGDKEINRLNQKAKFRSSIETTNYGVVPEDASSKQRLDLQSNGLKQNGLSVSDIEDINQEQ